MCAFYKDFIKNNTFSSNKTDWSFILGIWFAVLETETQHWKCALQVCSVVGLFLWCSPGVKYFSLKKNKLQLLLFASLTFSRWPVM